MSRRWALLVSLLILAILFPPWRKAGQWVNDRTGEPASPAKARDYDRIWWGYIPQYHWIGSPPPAGGAEERIHLRMNPDDDWHRMVSYQWQIDYLLLVGEIALVLVLLVFFSWRKGWTFRRREEQR